MTDPFPQHPRVTETLAIVSSAIADLERKSEAVMSSTTTCMDTTETVAITLNPYRWLTEVWIKPGTSKIGAAALNERLNEALTAANADWELKRQVVNENFDRNLANIYRELGAMKDKYDNNPHSGSASDNDDDGTDRW